MKEIPLYDVYIRLFFIVPLLFYTGITIMKEKTHSSSLLFHGIVILLIALTLFFHLRYLIRVLRRIFRNEKYQEDFGIFLVALAVFILVMTGREMIVHIHDKYV